MKYQQILKKRLLSNQRIIYWGVGLVAALLFIVVIRVIANTKTTVETTKTTTGVTIVLPSDISAYKNQMTEFVQMGGKNPLETMPFDKKQLTIAISGEVDIRRLSAQVAAQQFSIGGGPKEVVVDYFNFIDDTAYIMLNIDTDGRAGVSVAQAIIHPVVEMTLLQYPEIKKVVFGYPDLTNISFQ